MAKIQMTESQKSRAKLTEVHKAYLVIKTEIADFQTIEKLANTPELKAKMSAISNRYDADFVYLAKQRAYYVGKVLETSPSLFDEVLTKLLS